jgi:hypothetical protein
LPCTGRHYTSGFPLQTNVLSLLVPARCAFYSVLLSPGLRLQLPSDEREFEMHAAHFHRLNRANPHGKWHDNAKINSHQNQITRSTMGMFDDISCEQVLPAEPEPKDDYFQTKDFDRLMDHYTITVDGRLLKEKAEVQLHGVLNFYTYTDDDMWFEYEAEFTDGRLIQIRPISIYRHAAGGPTDEGDLLC